MKISEKLYGKMPEELKALFSKLPNPSKEEVIALFPTKDIPSGKASGPTCGMLGTHGRYGSAKGEIEDVNFYGDTGSASRFFYCAKASKQDRDEGLEDFEETIKDASIGAEDKRKNNHPTVKPTALMRYLCKLVTPKGGLIFDPFMGSGSTGKAALLEDFRFVGIDKEKSFFDIAKARIEHIANKDSMEWIK